MEQQCFGISCGHHKRRNGYNPSNGVFTAPTAGEYVFFVNVQGYRNQIIMVDIVQNGVAKVTTMVAGTDDFNDSGPNLAVLTLQTGDRVWDKCRRGNGYYTEHHLTTFSGFLI